MRHRTATLVTTCLYAATLFLSSLLLFLVEPMQGKLLLPLLGGAPAVWNTCMVFFQGALLAGYLYAHVLTTRVVPKWQLWVHAVVVLVPLAFMPSALRGFSAASAPPSEHPFLWVMGTLALASGPAFFALATTSPLLLAWYHRSGFRGAKNPYVLYAAGNVGSFLALLGYPLLVEPNLRLGTQGRAWTLGYAGFAAAVCAVALASRSRLLRVPRTRQPEVPARAVAWSDRLGWVCLAAVPSSLMLGVTTFMTVDVAAVPMLWMLPLLLYILSFVLVFARWSPRADRVVSAAVPWVVAAVLFLVFADYRKNMWAICALHLTGFLLVSLACHGRAALRKPAPRYLTQFFFCLSLGGVVGGLFNTLVAPLVFSRVAEYPVVMALAVMLLAWRPSVAPGRRTAPGDAPRPAYNWRVAALALAACGLFSGVLYGVDWLMHEQHLETLVTALTPVAGNDQAARAAVTYAVPLLLAVVFFLRPLYMGGALLGIALVALFYDADANVLYRSRSFFGVLTVKEYEGDVHSLVHGGILHGEQKLTTEADRLTPRSYYHRDGPLGEVMKVVEARVERPSIAAVGLGSGTVAAYGTSANTLTFYELDPNVERLARDPRYFTYVDDCLKRGCNLSVVLGDGRLMLSAATDKYDLIILDAFSSDAIPIHLLTSEALGTYVSRLTPGGLIAYHISNRYLDLEPVLLNLGKERRLIYTVNKDDGDDAAGRSGSTWVIMAAQDDLIGYLISEPQWTGLTPLRGVGVWADDYANVAKTFTWY